MTNSKSSSTKQKKQQLKQKPKEKKNSTRSLEESLDLVPLHPNWYYERSNPYGDFVGESTTAMGNVQVTVAAFSKGSFVTINRVEEDGNLVKVFTQFVEKPFKYDQDTHQI